MKIRESVLKNWDDLPEFMKVPEVRPYWEILDKKRMSLVIKRLFDIAASSVMLILMLIPMVIIGILIKIDSAGPVFYRQKRVTAYGKRFKIHKFRTMVDNADKIGAAVTISDDKRVTTLGRTLRKYRLDELPQLIDVLKGEMSFVGARPEVLKYVKTYSPEMRATLLMPAGITSEASIRFKDESYLLKEMGNLEDIDKAYIESILPVKMKWNLEMIRKFSLFREILTMIRTIYVIFGKKYG